MSHYLDNIAEMNRGNQATTVFSTMRQKIGSLIHTLKSYYGIYESHDRIGVFVSRPNKPSKGRLTLPCIYANYKEHKYPSIIRNMTKPMLYYLRFCIAEFPGLPCHEYMQTIKSINILPLKGIWQNQCSITYDFASPNFHQSGSYHLWVL